MKTDNKNVNIGLKYFKENTEKFFALRNNILLGKAGKDILGEDVLKRILKFSQEFVSLISECNIVKWLGSSGTTINYSAFFLNNEGSGYRYFKKANLEGDKFVTGLSDSIFDLVKIIFEIEKIGDRSNPVSEERKLIIINEIKKEIEESLPKATKNLIGIAKILWPVDKSDENTEDLRYILTSKDKDSDDGVRIQRVSPLLEVIKELDLKELLMKEDHEELQKRNDQIEQLKSKLKATEQEKNDIKKDSTIENLRESLGDEASKYFSTDYKKIRKKFEAETKSFLRFKKFLKQEPSHKKTDELKIENSDKKIEDKKAFFKNFLLENFTKSELGYGAIFSIFIILTFYALSLYPLVFFTIGVGLIIAASRFCAKKTPQLFFNLSFKIFLLRLITYSIPIFLVTFHFCELFDPSGKSGCKPCYWLAIDSIKNVEKSKVSQSNYLEVSTKEAKIEINQNHDFGAKNGSNNSYLYFHLALITTLLLAFQQLRSAVKEMNIKKSLIEVYRHRELVAINSTKMRQVVDADDKSEVVKSAAKALFENEPAIHQSSSNLPPKAFDINFSNK